MTHLWWTVLDVVLDVVLAVAVGAAAAFAGGPIVVACFRRIDPPDLVAAERALPGGAWIGVLERVAV